MAESLEEEIVIQTPVEIPNYDLHDDAGCSDSDSETDEVYSVALANELDQKEQEILTFTEGLFENESVYMERLMTLIQGEYTLTLKLKLLEAAGAHGKHFRADKVLKHVPACVWNHVVNMDAVQMIDRQEFRKFFKSGFMHIRMLKHMFLPNDMHIVGSIDWADDRFWAILEMIRRHGSRLSADHCRYALKHIPGTSKRISALQLMLECDCQLAPTERALELFADCNDVQLSRVKELLSRFTACN